MRVPTIMKKLAILIIAIVCATASFAQAPEREFRRFELENAGGAGGGLISLTSELRYNFIRHWDVGLQANIDYFGFKINAVTDYNFILPNRNVSFFAGFGAGCGDISLFSGPGEELGQESTKEVNNSDWQFHIMPRVGVELFQHLRFSIILHSYYTYRHTYPMLSIGVVIGGGRIHKRNHTNPHFL